MKQKFLILLIIFSGIIFAADLGEFEYFLRSKAEIADDIIVAEKSFDEFEKLYPESCLVKSGYFYFYIGKVKYKLKKYEEAISYLEKTNFFQEERDYLMGESYYFLGDMDKAMENFFKLNLNYYNSDSIIFEGIALKKLGERDYYYNIIFNSKFNDDLSEVWDLKDKDLKILLDYFLSNGSDKSAGIILKELLTRHDVTEEEKKFLEGLNYYLNGDYRNAYKHLAWVKSPEAKDIRIKSFRELGWKDLEKKATIDLIVTFPRSKKAAEYRYMLYQEDGNKNYLNWIVRYNSDSKYYFRALKKVYNSVIPNIKQLDKKYLELNKDILELKKMRANNSEIEIFIEYSVKSKRDGIYKDYLKAKLLKEE